MAIIIIGFIACNIISTPKEKAFEFSKFPKERSIDTDNYLKIENLKPDGMIMYQDSLLIFRNAANTSTHHFSFFNLNDKTLSSKEILKFGRKSGQAMAFISYGIFDNSLWVYDVIKEKIIISNLTNALKGDTSKLIKNEFNVPKPYYSVEMLNNKMMIADGDYDSNYRVVQVNLQNGEIEKQLAPYSIDSSTVFTRPKKMAYESFLYLKPSGDKFVLAARYADRIQIVDIKSNSSKIIKGPENYDPDVVTMKGNDGKQLSTRGPNTRYAFVKGKTTDDFIYLLYSGNNSEGDHLYYGKYIYVYDWKGNPIEKIAFSDYILDFAVTSDGSKIYTYDPKNKYVTVAKLK